MLVQKTRLLGAEHEITLTSMTNLAFSLSRCGQEAECEQILRDTLALCWRALGPAHGLTQNVLGTIWAVGLAAQ